MPELLEAYLDGARVALPSPRQSSEQFQSGTLNKHAPQFPEKRGLFAEKTEDPWTFEVSLKPGIHALIAKADGGRRMSRPHTIVVDE